MRTDLAFDTLARFLLVQYGPVIHAIFSKCAHIVGKTWWLLTSCRCTCNLPYDAGSAQATPTGAHTTTPPDATTMPPGLSFIPTTHTRLPTDPADLTFLHAVTAIILAVIVWRASQKLRTMTPVKPRTSSGSTLLAKRTSLSRSPARATTPSSPSDALISSASVSSSTLSPSSRPPAHATVAGSSDQRWYRRVKEWLAQCFNKTTTDKKQNNPHDQFFFPFSLINYRASPYEPSSSSGPSPSPTLSTDPAAEPPVVDELREDEDEDQESVIRSALDICDCGSGAPHIAGLHHSLDDRDVPQGRQVRIDSWTFPIYQVDEPIVDSADCEPLPIRVVEGPPPSPTSSVSSISSAPSLDDSAVSSESDTDAPADTSLHSEGRWRWDELTVVDPCLDVSVQAVATREEEEFVKFVAELPQAQDASSTPVKGRAAAARMDWRGLSSVSSPRGARDPADDDDGDDSAFPFPSSSSSGSPSSIAGLSRDASGGRGILPAPSWASHVFDEMTFPRTT
ncbi:hypothetical protein PYCCODRAFT_789122 [Trametes coccinea BRFM310]|uniref:Uncharacterized protein n=1 Tax=Trametes coccinea (strain BRFM310) TaxID=1353009 RepID=A0A1Y2J0X4_TRAC3|nr:hypothetical protein PYCCODRAFT_789122 [Trametes coccinea BRFM310]